MVPLSFFIRQLALVPHVEFLQFFVFEDLLFALDEYGILRHFH